MGYETKMYVAEVHDDFMDWEEGRLAYAQVIGMVDLCKTGYYSNTGELIRRQTTKEPVVFFYGTDGNTRVTEDHYGDALGVISIPDMIAAMKADIEADKAAGELPYRRFVIALAMLEQIAETFDLSKTFVITFGH
jgi:hypothetical protein